MHILMQYIAIPCNMSNINPDETMREKSTVGFTNIGNYIITGVSENQKVVHASKG